MCKYKDILGIPFEGIHKYRFLNIAIIDMLFTIIGAFYLNKWIKKSYKFIKFYQILIILLIFGIILHRLFCVKTTIDILLFGL
jgi:hypothetical protein